MEGLIHDMKLDAEQHRFIADGPSMGSSRSERLEILFARSAYVLIVDESEGNPFDRVDLNVAIAYAVSTAGLHPRPPPQPE